MLVVVNVDLFMIQKQAKGLVTLRSVDVLFYVWSEVLYMKRTNCILFCFYI